MTDTASSTELRPSADLDFHFDPGCPFAWQTSRWITKVRDLSGITVDWRLISLKFLNEDQPPSPYSPAQDITHGVLRVIAAVIDEVGTDPVWSLYTAWGERLWNAPLPNGDFVQAVADIDVAEVLRACGVDERFAAAAQDESWDAFIRAETEAAIGRTGPDVGTPILTFWPTGNAYFGPVISSVPGDEDSVRIYEALRTLVDFDTFSEIKRTKRPGIALTAFGG